MIMSFNYVFPECELVWAAVEWQYT